MRSSRGFSLIELMIVVALIMILATIAAGSWRRYVARVRVTEVSAMFAEFRAKEEAYRAEFGTYLSVNANENVLYPCLDQSREPFPKDWAGGGVAAPSPAGGCANNFPALFGRTGLGVTPFRPQLYCAYSVIAGSANTVAPAATVRVISALGGTPTTPWWAAVALCDSDGWGPPPANGLGASNITTMNVMTNDTHVFITTSQNANMIQFNEGR